MTELARATPPRTSVMKAVLFFLVASTAMFLPERAEACRTWGMLLTEDSPERRTSEQMVVKLSVEEALVMPGREQEPFAYRMRVIESDGALQIGEQIMVAAPDWDHCSLVFMGIPDEAGNVSGYARVQPRAKGESYYRLSNVKPSTLRGLDWYRTDPEKFVWRRIRFKQPWASEPSQ